MMSSTGGVPMGVRGGGAGGLGLSDEAVVAATREHDPQVMHRSSSRGSTLPSFGGGCNFHFPGKQGLPSRKTYSVDRHGQYLSSERGMCDVGLATSGFEDVHQAPVGVLYNVSNVSSALTVSPCSKLHVARHLQRNGYITHDRYIYFLAAPQFRNQMHKTVANVGTLQRSVCLLRRSSGL